MALVTDRLAFLHVPKTGGIWVKHALNVGGAKVEEIGQQHEHFPALLQYRSEEFWRSRLVFTFVRHPATWYQSRWAFRVKNGWQARHPLDWNTASNNFRQFVENALAFKPDGWCTWLFDQYINGLPGITRYVGRMESLVDDFLTVCEMAKQPIDEKSVRAIAPVNTSDMDERNSGYWAKYTESLLFRVLAVESQIVRTYYPNYVIDPNTLCGRLNY